MASRSGERRRGLLESENSSPEGMRRWLFGIVRFHKWRLLVLILLTITASSIGLAVPWPMQILADYVFGELQAPSALSAYSQTFTLLYIAAGLALAIFALSELVGLLSTYFGEKFLYRIEEGVQVQTFRKILATRAWEHSRLDAGDYSYRLNVATREVANLVFNAPSFIAGSLFTIFSTLLIMLQLNRGMALIAISIVVPLGLASRYFSRKIQSVQNDLEQIESGVFNFTNESIENTELIQSFDRQDHKSRSFVEILRERFSKRLRMSLLGESMGITSGGIVALSMFIIMVVGGRRVFAGQLTFGELLVFTAYIQNFFGPVDRLISGFVSMKQSAVIVGRVFDIVDTEIAYEPEGRPGYQKDRFETSLEFRNVSIGYPAAPPTLLNMNFTIRPGQKVGIFGPSGSGKSTLLAACNGQLPYGGNILLDGLELAKVHAKSRSSIISVVSQNPMLFTDSIFNNVSFGLDANDEGAVMEALELAGAMEFVRSLPDGHHTVIGASGVSLSGGEAQRIALARALVTKPQILILDEPTSALDPEAERAVLKTLFDRLKPLSILFVTHKPHFLELMDQNLILGDGTVTDVANLGGVENFLSQNNMGSGLTSKPPTEQARPVPMPAHAKPVSALPRLHHLLNATTGRSAAEQRTRGSRPRHIMEPSVVWVRVPASEKNRESN